MAVLPGSLALKTIPDGALATAADLRNNFTAIQTENNAVLTALGAGTSGDVLLGNGTTVTFAKPPGYEFARTQITASVTVSGTSGAPTTVIGPTSSVTFDGSTAVDIVLGGDAVNVGGSDTVICELYEDATSLGIIAAYINPAAGSMSVPLRGELRRTPSAAGHTYTVKAYRTTNNGSVAAAAGGAGAGTPAFLKVIKA